MPLAEATVRPGFNNVIDAFHISRGGEPTQTRFFIDERATRNGITLTDDLLELANGLQARVLPLEVDARWKLVQTPTARSSRELSEYRFRSAHA